MEVQEEVKSDKAGDISITVSSNSQNTVVQERRSVALPGVISKVRFQNLAAESDLTVIPVSKDAIQVLQVQPESVNTNLSTLQPSEYAKLELFYNLNDTLVPAKIIAKDNNFFLLRVANNTIAVPASAALRSIVQLNISNGVIGDNTRTCVIRADGHLDAPQQIDLVYQADLTCSARYTVVISESENLYHFQGQYHVQNNTDVDFSNVDLTFTDLGQEPTRAPKSKTKNKNSFSNINSKKMKPSLHKRNSSGDDYYSESRSYSESGFSRPPTANPLGTSYQWKSRVDLPRGLTSLVFTQGIIQPINKHYLLSFPAPAHLTIGVGDLHDESSDGQFDVETYADEVLEVQNLLEQGLGLPLPPGKLQVVYGDNRNGSSTLENSQLDNVAATEESEFISLKLGQVKSIVGTRTQQSFSNSHGSIVETINLKIKNHSHQPVNLLVEDVAIRWHAWKVTTPTPALEFHPNGKNKFRWYLQNILPNAEETITYTIQYDYNQ